jgi:hypothetical protein
VDDVELRGSKKHKGKKFVHPANANRSHHKRTNFQGRRQPDFGQKTRFS